jgi:hypothetical protein
MFRRGAGISAGTPDRLSGMLLGLLVFLPAFVAAKTTLPACPTGEAAPQVARLVLTSEIADREPVDSLNDLHAVPPTLYLFTEMRFADDRKLMHDWYVDDVLVSRTRLEIGTAERWRTWSQVAGWRMAGKLLRIEVKEPGACLFEAREYRIGNAESAPASLPANTLTTAADHAPNDAERARLENAARRAKLGGDLPSARRLLNEAIKRSQYGSEAHDRLRDELYFFLPLMQLDAQLYLGDHLAAEATLRQLILYLGDHPQRIELRRELAEYAKRVAKLRAEHRTTSQSE